MHFFLINISRGFKNKKNYFFILTTIDSWNYIYKFSLLQNFYFLSINIK